MCALLSAQFRLCLTWRVCLCILVGAGQSSPTTITKYRLWPCWGLLCIAPSPSPLFLCKRMQIRQMCQMRQKRQLSGRGTRISGLGFVISLMAGGSSGMLGISSMPGMLGRWADVGSRRLFALINCQCLGIISTHLSLQQCKSGCHCVSCCKSQESAHVQQAEKDGGGRSRKGREENRDSTERDAPR